MANSADNLLNFFKKEIVFCLSAILAIVSCFFVRPNINYLNYINWDTILLLLVIMLVVEVLKNLSVFEILARKLLVKVKNTRALVLFLIFTCFFSSIFITNDVTLIIFIPFTLLALKKVNRLDLAIFTVSMQTIAANVGCMVLPIGAPHNIVMYTVSNIAFESFFLLLLPYIVVSVVFLIVLSLFVSNDPIALPQMSAIEIDRNNFFKRVFTGIDYYLLLTFIALFILIGNLQNIPFFSQLFESWIVGNEVLSGVILSQVISNVPAAMLLSGFSTNYDAIIIGINVGGFGTLIASMANLISFKILVREYDGFKLKYLAVFTVLNVVLLAVLLGVYFLM